MAKTLTKKQQRILHIIAFVVAVGIVLVIVGVVGVPFLRFISQPERFREWVEARGVWGKLAFVGIEICKVILVVIPGEPIEIAAGYAFGTLESLFLCMIGITIGSMIVLLLVRRFGMSVVEIFFSREKVQSMHFLRTTQRQNVILAFIYILPGTPKDFLNYYVGLTDMPIHVWFWVCSVGRIPSIITSTISGNAFGEKRYLFGFLFTLATLALGLIGLIIYNRISSKEQEINKDLTEEERTE